MLCSINYTEWSIASVARFCDMCLWKFLLRIISCLPVSANQPAKWSRKLFSKPCDWGNGSPCTIVLVSHESWPKIPYNINHNENDDWGLGRALIWLEKPEKRGSLEMLKLPKSAQYSELCKNIPAKFWESLSKCSAAHTKLRCSAICQPAIPETW